MKNGITKDESKSIGDFIKKSQKLNLSNVRYSLPLTNQKLWDMAKIIVEKQKEAIKLENDIDWNMLEEMWFDWLEESLFADKN